MGLIIYIVGCMLSFLYWIYGEYKEVGEISIGFMLGMLVFSFGSWVTFVSTFLTFCICEYKVVLWTRKKVVLKKENK